MRKRLDSDLTLNELFSIESVEVMNVDFTSENFISDLMSGRGASLSRLRNQLSGQIDLIRPRFRAEVTGGDEDMPEITLHVKREERPWLSNDVVYADPNDEDSAPHPIFTRKKYPHRADPLDFYVSGYANNCNGCGKKHRPWESGDFCSACSATGELRDRSNNKERLGIL